MLDEEVGDEATPADGRRTSTTTFVLSATGLGILLSVAFFPAYFSIIENYDDEGSFLVAVRQFMHHGSLYSHTHGSYGPFYFSVAGLIFRLTGHDPTLFSGRLVVLAFTALAAGMFAAAVWRVTRSLVFSLLCEVTTYCILIRVAGKEPMHPGSMIVLLLSVLAYALVRYVMQQQTSSLVFVGMILGALAMIKVNIGIFATTAVVVGFVVGNSQYSKRVRVIVAAAAVLLPFGLMFQRLYQVETLQFAVIVSVGLLATYAPLSVDTIALPRRAIWVMAGSAAAVVAVSCLWPLATGTSPGALIYGVVIQPLGQTEHLAVSTPVQFQWFAFLATACGIYAVLARRNAATPQHPRGRKDRGCSMRRSQLRGYRCLRWASSRVSARGFRRSRSSRLWLGWRPLPQTCGSRFVSWFRWRSSNTCTHIRLSDHRFSGDSSRCACRARSRSRRVRSDSRCGTKRVRPCARSW